METTARLTQRKNELLAQLAALGPMRKGTLSDQYVETILKDGAQSRRGQVSVSLSHPSAAPCGSLV